MTALRKNDFRFICPECEKRTNNHEKLYNHLMNEHAWNEKETRKYMAEIELKIGLS